MNKIVLTGGPCSGKTTVLRALKEEFGEKIIIVPEVATIILEGGFPLPGKDIEWSEEWQASLQAAILPLQKSFEKAHSLKAEKNDGKILICDRGVLDGAAYTPGGVSEFCKKYKVNHSETLSRYKAVIHLESLAVVDPEKYGKTGNDKRFETLKQAQEIEHATRDVWKNHTRRTILNGKRGIVNVISETIGIVRFLLTEVK